jgi:hypothetical protein
MKQRIPEARAVVEAIEGIVAWVRSGPSRALAGLEGATGLPYGFWFVLGLSVVVSIFSTAVVVGVVYRGMNQSPRAVRVPSVDGRVPDQQERGGAG